MAQFKITNKDVVVPADVPKAKQKEFINNYLEITKGSGHLMLFAGDQKIEHLNDDFWGPNISRDDASPDHLFKIASQAKIGCFATQFGLISRYGRYYGNIPYLVKLNSKTNLIKASERDPISSSLVDVEDVVRLKREANLSILGVGFTVYLGSEYENIMLAEAARIVHQAHQNSLIAVLWLYPRGKAVANEKNPHLIAGAAGVAACLGADFAKINEPVSDNPIEDLKEAVLAAGNTKLICAGGHNIEAKEFLERLYRQINVAGTAGNGTGRNIHQKPLDKAIKMANAIYAISVEGKTAEEAYKIYQEETKK